jgi:hypothetical protein
VSTNVTYLQLQPDGRHAFGREPLEEAVGEVSARLALNNSERRRLYSRLDELRSSDPALRRSGPRSLLPDPLRPLTIFSIEEADSGDSGRRVHGA